MTIEKETKMYVVECSAVITGEGETKESALATYMEEFAKGNLEITVREVEDKTKFYEIDNNDESLNLTKPIKVQDPLTKDWITAFYCSQIIGQTFR